MYNHQSLVMLVLQQHGPLTTKQIADYVAKQLGYRPRRISTVITRLRRDKQVKYIPSSYQHGGKYALV